MILTDGDRTVFMVGKTGQKYVFSNLPGWHRVDHVPAGTSVYTVIREPEDRWLSGLGELLGPVSHMISVDKITAEQLATYIQAQLAYWPDPSIGNNHHTANWLHRIGPNWGIFLFPNLSGLVSHLGGTQVDCAQHHVPKIFKARLKVAAELAGVFSPDSAVTKYLEPEKAVYQSLIASDRILA